MALDLELPCRPESVGRARDALSHLEVALSDRRLGDLRLLVSEVVTNAVRHAGLGPGDSIRLRVAGGDERVRVEVGDTGRGFAPGPRDAEVTRPGGWGLYLVEQLADRWGVETSDGTVVWFELSGG